MKVQFLKNTANAIIDDYPENTFILFPSGYNYNIPDIDGTKCMPFNEFRKKYQVLNICMFIIIGLNRIINPSNRCDFIFEYLQTMTPHIPKISIDTFPFIGEPWRLWFHYSIANCGNFKINYSYAIETEWKHWFYRDTNQCRLSGDSIKLFITDTYSNLDRLNTQFSFYQPAPLDIEYYEEVKKFVFDKYNSPKMWINNILKLCNRHFDIKFGYDSYLKNTNFELPELGIYKFIAEENDRRMKIYNAVIS